MVFRIILPALFGVGLSSMLCRGSYTVVSAVLLTTLVWMLFYANKLYTPRPQVLAKPSADTAK